MTITKLHIAELTTGTVGTDAHEPFVVYEGDTDDDIQDTLWQMACDNAEMYGIYPRGYEYDEWDDDESDDTGWGSDQYSDDIDGYIGEEYTPETAAKLDGNRSGGGSFAKDFIRMYEVYGQEVPQWLFDHLDGKI